MLVKISEDFLAIVLGNLKFLCEGRHGRKESVKQFGPGLAVSSNPLANGLPRLKGPRRGDRRWRMLSFGILSIRDSLGLLDAPARHALASAVRSCIRSHMSFSSSGSSPGSLLIVGVGVRVQREQEPLTAAARRTGVLLVELATFTLVTTVIRVTGRGRGGIRGDRQTGGDVWQIGAGPARARQAGRRDGTTYHSARSPAHS
jgi:hypothetical protein